jgi:predicted DNA-binding transcriptional regulator YafY
MKTASRPPLRRLLAIDQMIRSGRFPNATSAAVELEVHARTIARDLAFLRDSWGAPLEFNRDRNGYCYCDPDYALPLQRLTEGELVALLLAERVMRQYKGTPYAHDLATAFRKLTAALPEQVSIDLNHLTAAYSFRHPVGSGDDPRQFRLLTRAVRENRRLELIYWTASRDETCRRVVDPYHLTSVDGDWYLVAYCHLREEVRMFVPARIRQLKDTGEFFEPPSDFQIGHYLDNSFRVMRGNGKPQRVRLRFAPEAARYVREKVWHPSQRLRTARDGSLEVSVRVSHLHEVKRWVLSYGGACEVLEPKELRTQIRKELLQAIKQYRGASVDIRRMNLAIDMIEHRLP